jgi:hypothetical protein
MKLSGGLADEFRTAGIPVGVLGGVVAAIDVPLTTWPPAGS